MLQSSPSIFKFSWFFRCLLIVTPTENSSPAPSVPGHVDSILSVCIYCLAAGLQKINSSVYKGRQTPWPAQELHILSVRNSHGLFPSEQGKPCPPRGARRCPGEAVSACGSARGRSGAGGAMRGVCEAARLRSPLPPSAAGELVRGLWLCSALPADISVLLALGSRLAALPLNARG